MIHIIDKRSNSPLLPLALISLFFFSFPSPQFCHAETADNFPEPASAALPEAELDTVAERSAVVEIAEAQDLADAGKLTEAREGLQEFLAGETVSAEAKSAAEEELESLNMKILFSPVPTDDSLIYEVKLGDNLHDIAKKFKTTVALIKKSNQLEKDTIYPGQKFKIEKAEFSIEVDKSDNLLKLFQGEKLLKTYRVGTGENNSTPVGEFTIANKLENPTWYHAGAAVPPESPDNILGTRWMGFKPLKEYGIHGTTLPESIGKQESSGCLRMFNQDVEELYTIVPLGTRVVIHD